MKDEEKRELVEAVGLCWHCWAPNREDVFCDKCGEESKEKFQLDPLSPADMYGKIWVAFNEQNPEDGYRFLERLFKTQGWLSYAHTLTSAPDLAKAMFEYFRSKGGGNDA